MAETTNVELDATSRAVQVRAMTPDDWPAVAGIYAAGIATGNATFETARPTWEAWDKSHLSSHRLVAVDDSQQVVGWCRRPERPPSYACCDDDIDC